MEPPADPSAPLPAPLHSPGPLAPPWPPWPQPELPAWVVVLLVPAVLLVSLTLQGGLQLLNLGLALWFTEVFVFLAIPWLLARFREEHPMDVARGRWVGWAPLGWGTALGIANFFGAVIPLQFISHQLFPEDWVKAFDMSHLFQRQDPVDLVLLLAAVSVAAPVCEEMFFRGFLQERLTRVIGSPWRMTVFTAAVFSAFHLDPVGFLARFELGLLFGLLYWRMGSLWPGVMAHAANNVTSTVLYLLARSQAETGAEAESEPEGWAVALLTGVGLLAFGTLLRFALRARNRPAPPPSPTPLTPRAVWPWPLAALLSIGLFVSLDLRGIRLNLIDSRIQLPGERRDADEHEEDLLDDLFQLRWRARQGHASLEEYEQKRQEAADLLRLREE